MSTLPRIYPISEHAYEGDSTPPPAKATSKQWLVTLLAVVAGALTGIFVPQATLWVVAIAGLCLVLVVARYASKQRRSSKSRQ